MCPEGREGSTPSFPTNKIQHVRAACAFLARRTGADKLWAAGVALAFGSTPVFLFYAFEARVFSLAALLVIASAVLSVLWFNRIRY